jgi:hypothetical protein
LLSINHGVHEMRLQIENGSSMPQSRKDWAREITFLYGKTVAAIIEVGRKLNEAKAALPHGDFSPMIKRDLPFGERSAQQYMQIARHSVLSNPQSSAHLPSSVCALAELARMPEAELEDAIERGDIRPDMVARDVAWLQDLNRLRPPEEIQPPPAPRPPPLSVVEKDPPTCNQRSGAATAFNAADSEIAIAEVREPQAIEGDSENLAAIKILWAQLTESDRRQFLRWTGN